MTKGVYGSVTYLLSMCAMNLKKETRERLVGGLFFFVVLFTWIDKTIVELSSPVIYLFSCAAPFLAVLILNDGRFGRIKMNRISAVLFIAFVLTFLIGAIMTLRMGSVILAVTYAVAFPLLAMVSSKEKVGMIMRRLCWSVTANFYIIIVLSLIAADPNEQTQYSGIIVNPNTLGLFSFVAFIAFIYNIYRRRKLYDYAGLGLAAITVYMTQSRTSLICVVVATVFIIIALLKSKDRSAVGIKQLAVAILAAVALFCAVFYLSPISEKTHDYINTTLIRDEARENIRDVEMEERNFDRLIQSIEGGNFTTGRLGIWQIYLSQTGIAPNGDDEPLIVNGEEINMSAHNTYIHLAYCFGLLCGVFYLLYNISVGIVSLKLLVERKNLLYIINFIIVLCYGVVTLVETSYNITSYLICFVYWLLTFTVSFVDLDEEE